MKKDDAGREECFACWACWQKNLKPQNLCPLPLQLHNIQLVMFFLKYLTAPLTAHSHLKMQKIKANCEKIKNLGFPHTTHNTQSHTTTTLTTHNTNTNTRAPTPTPQARPQATPTPTPGHQHWHQHLT